MHATPAPAPQELLLAGNQLGDLGTRELAAALHHLPSLQASPAQSPGRPTPTTAGGICEWTRFWLMRHVPLA